MADLVTLAQAKRHLKLSPPGSPPTEEDFDVEEKVTQASALIADYVAQRRDTGAWALEVAAWDVTASPPNVPPIVQAAVLLQVTELYRFRGDDAPGEIPIRTPGFLSPAVVSLLHRLRDPAIS